MSKATKKVKVTLRAGFKLPQRSRAGFQFVKNETKVLDLTKEQVEAFKNDPWFKTGAPGKSDEATPVTSDQETQADESQPDQTDEADEDQDTETTPQDEGSDSAPETEEGDAADAQSDEQDSEPTPEQDLNYLLQNSRPQLNDIAKEAGVADPESFENKQQVAEAIVAKRS